WGLCLSPHLRAKTSPVFLCHLAIPRTALPPKRSLNLPRSRPAQRGHTRSWMRRDSDDCNLALLWAIAPEDAVGAGRAVLNVRLEDRRVRIVGVLDRVVFVCLEARVARVCLE